MAQTICYAENVVTRATVIPPTIQFHSLVTGTFRRYRTPMMGRRGRLPTEHICPSGQVLARLRVCHSGD
jgi:hypothetical protein